MQHSYKAALLACLVLDSEMEFLPCINPYLVLKAVVVHDLGEIATGDTVYRDKTEEGDRKEHSFFEELISTLSEKQKERLNDAYHLQHAQKEGFSDIADELRRFYHKEAELFEAIERLGYVIFAYREFKENPRGKKIFVQTLRNQHERLKELAMGLPGFRNVFYTPEIQESVEKFLKGYEGQFIEQKGE